MIAVDDVRYALRGIWRSPGWSLAAIITLALGIGANATMFALVDRLLLRPPAHVEDPGRVVRLAFEFDGGNGETFSMSTTSYPVFEDVRRAGASFSSVAAVVDGEMVFGSGADARSVSAAKVTTGYFDLLGTRPLAGRFFGTGEDATPVAVVSYGFWQRELGGSRNALLSDIVLDGTTYRVVGVAPADFNGDENEPLEVWVPLEAAMGQSGTAWRTERHMRLVRIVGRLAEGASPATAAGEAGAVLTSLAPGLGTRAATTQSRIALWVAAMSVVVLLIAIVNVANLMLFRAAGRRREIAVRLAMGAGRWHLTRQLVVESLVLAAIGGAGAMLAAAWGSEAIRAVLLPNMAGADRLVSWRLLAITAGATIAAGVLTGLVPALRSSSPSLVDDLRTGGGAGRGRSWTPSALLVAQGALCTLLLVGASLFLLSLHRVRTQDFGFTSDGLLLAEMRFPQSARGSMTDAAYLQAQEHIRRLSGVSAATVVQVAPFSGHNVPPISVPGRPDFPDLDQQAPFLAAASPEYFGVLGMRLLDGRNFTPQDGAGSQLVMIVNQAMAEGLWPGESAIGKCVRVGFLPGVPPEGIIASPLLPCRTIVGVVNNARPRSIREETGQARMHYYVPFEQIPAPPFPGDHPKIWALLIRTADADAMAAPVQRALQSFAPGLPYAQVRPLQDVLERQMRPWMLGATMFTVFGLLALGLAMVGLYGVRAYSVAQRTREIGVRMALGARIQDVVRLVMTEGLRVTAAGIAIGISAAALLGGRLEPLLFETSATDMRVFAIVTGVLFLVAVMASALPAWRAARVDPNVALRSE